MKYYIDGKLVFASNRTYTHAVMMGDKVVSCAKSFELAQKAMARESFQCHELILHNMAAIRAIDEGKAEYWTMDGHAVPYLVTVTGTRKDYEERIAFFNEQLDCFRIRELEAR